MSQAPNKIILITDIYEIRRRKEEELRYYHEQLEKLQNKMFFIKKEIELTNIIIEMIENEKVTEIKKVIKDE